MANIKRFLTLILFSTLSALTMSSWGDTSTLNFTAACGGSGTADDGAVWTVTSDAAESNFDATSGIHYGTNSASVTYVQLSTSDITGTISQVVVNCRDARATATVSVEVDGDAYTCGGGTTATNSSADYTFTGSSSGEIVVRVDRGSSNTKAIYVKSVVVTYSGGGGSTYTVTLDKNGTTANITDCSGTYTLPTTGEHVADACTGWAWHCWANAQYAESTTAPSSTVITTMSSAGTAYAVYRNGNGTNTEFNVASIASANSWSNGTAYTSYTISPITVAYSGGGNNGKYYVSNNSWRVYNGGTVTITSSGEDISSVTTSPSVAFTISGKTATFSPTSTTEFTSIIVATGTMTYNSTPSCSGLQVSTTSLDFGTKNINTNTSRTITVTGTELTADATLSISGTNAGMFSVSPSTLAKVGTTITGTDNVTVTYSPTALGSHTATLTITSGSFTKTVTLTGECAVTCTDPTLSFGGVTSLEKVLGSGNFTTTATATGNTLGAAITYSSSNTDKAEVNATTGEVTLKEATGSGTQVTITATLAAKTVGSDCQNEATASYTLTIYNKVTWMVGEDEYTTGSPTTQVLQGGKITQLPSDPDGLCGDKVFRGWTTSEIDDPTDEAPSPLYKSVNDLSSVYITQNTTFYAVFATASTGVGSGDYELVESDPGAANWAGDYLIAYSDAIFADGRVGGTGAGGIGAQNVRANPGDNLDGKVVDGTWGDTYNVTIEKIGTTNTYVLKTKDGKYNYRTANSNGLDETENLSTADNYPLTITFNSSSDIAIAMSLVSPSPVFHYNTQGYFRFYASGGQSAIYLYKKVGGTTTYSDFATVCGTCLPAPTSPTITVQSDRATISWSAVTGATGYTVTCSGGSVSVSGTTATITGLASTTTYTFTIRSQGSDPYTCFPAYHGSFTTTDCADIPALGTVTVTSTTATIPWTCEAATATIRIYKDAACTEQEGADHTLCTSPYTVTTLVSNTTYYYKVMAGGTCSSAVGTFKTEEIKLDIAEWQTDAVIVNYNGDASLTLTSYTEETHGDPHANVADDIFFSKYFEAAAGVKLLAVFNGTLNSVDLSNYKLGLAQASEGVNTTKAFEYKKFSEIKKYGGAYLTADELLLKSNEELILITYGNSDDDKKVIKCAEDDEEHAKFSTYIRISTPALQFNGDDAVALMNPDDDMIDLIGAGTKADGLTRHGASFQSCSSSAGTLNGFMDSPGGWYTANGYHAKSDNTEESGYGLSSNRCLLIRRNYVKSGHDAVVRNAEDFVTLGDYSYMGEDYEGEWKGVQIPGSTQTYPYAAFDNSCDGFAVVGGYNYNDYYIDFEVNGTPTTFDDLKSDPFDGTYIIPVDGLSDKACTMVRIELTDASGNLVIRKDVKVPIMIDNNKNTTDAVFHSHDKDAAICSACDVVIFGNASLTKVADGTTNDIPQVRDVEIYPGGKLVIPADAGSDTYEYTVNTLSLRRQEDEVAMADVQGTLNIQETKGVRLDLRIDPTNWHYITLPANCNVSDIEFSDGTDAVVGTDFYIKEYDGAHRAATQSTSWSALTSSSVLQKGIGYIVALPGSGIIKKDLIFPMANSVIDEENDDKTISGLHAWGGDDSELRPNHKGWNLVGNPFMMYYDVPSMTTPLAAGTLIHDPSENPWQGHWSIAEGSTGLYYIVVPQNHGMSEYLQTTVSSVDMPPFTSYFVQIGGSDPSANQGIEFAKANKENKPSSVAVRRTPADDEVDNHEIWFSVDLFNADGESDATTLLISDQFTNDYDMMRDLVKMRGAKYTRYTKPVLASRNDEGEMAFNALPDSTAAAGVPLNFFAAQDGQYRFTVSANYSLDEIAEAYLYDNENAGNKWHNLLASDYSFTAPRGDNTERFLLAVKVERKQPEVTTNIDNATSNLTLTTIDRTLIVSGLTSNSDIYVYDVSGKLLNTERHSSSVSGIFRTTVEDPGVYFVRVNGTDGQQTLRTIVY